MEQIKVVKFLEEKKNYLFPNKNYTDLDVEEALLSAPDSFEYTMSAIPFKNPTTMQILSFFIGSLGVDRFCYGDIKCGILKYFTFGGLGIWWIIDLINAKNMCRAYNCKKLIAAVNDPAVVAKMQKNNETLHKAFEVAKAAAPVVKAAKDGMKDVSDTFYVN